MKSFLPRAVALLAVANVALAGGARSAAHGVFRRAQHDLAPIGSPPLDIALAASAALSRKDNQSLNKVVDVPFGGQTQRAVTAGVLGVLGGALCHLVLGTIYCWGNFLPYVPPHLKNFNGQLRSGQPDAVWVLAGTFVSQALAMPIGPIFQEKIGCRNTTFLGCSLMILGVYLASLAKNLLVFFLSYSILFGTGVGIAYTAPMVNGWRWFPDKKGLVGGAVVAGFGSGGFIFNQVGTKFINPDSLNAVDGVYPSVIYENFPKMLRKLATIYVVLAGIGALFVVPPPADAATAAKSKAKTVDLPKGSSLREALASEKFWMMWGMVLLIATGGINVANSYKAYAGTVDVLKSDKFQSMVGSVAALCNGGGRLFWGNMLDAFGFKKPFTVLASTQALATVLYTTLCKSKAGYLIGTGLLLFCLGGNFAIFPALTTKVFGAREGATIYGVLFTAFATASISASFLTQFLQNNFGWNWGGVFNLMSTLSILSLLALPFFETS